MENYRAIDAIRMKAISKGWNIRANIKVYDTNKKDSLHYSFFFFKNNNGRGMHLSEKEIKKADTNDKTLTKILDNVDELLTD